MTKNMTGTFEAIKLGICDRLKTLNPHFTYHNLAHTLDVLEQCERIAGAEGIEDEQLLFLLKVAALYHDTGFLSTYANHEEMSCKIFLDDTASYNFLGTEKAFVTSLIMATKIPQTPTNLFEKIICDADLDYLGRPDFFTIGDGLRKEFLYYGIVSSDEEWEKLQIKFLTAHSYHTDTSKNVREEEKKKYLALLQ